MNAQTEPESGDLVNESKDMAVTDGGGMLALIERMATDDRVDPDKLMRMLEVKERWENREAEKAFNQDFIELQNDLPDITEGGQIVHKEKLISKYARWDEDINPAIKPILAKHGFTLSFETNTRDGIHVTAHLIHRDGHSRSGSFSLPADTSGAKNAVQAVGSSVSYAKRYAAGPLLNITTRGIDDDGDAAGKASIELINEEEAAKIRDYIDALEIDEAKFLEYLDAESVEQIPYSKLKRAMDAIKRKEKAKE